MTVLAASCAVLDLFRQKRAGKDEALPALRAYGRALRSADENFRVLPRPDVRRQGEVRLKGLAERWGGCPAARRQELLAALVEGYFAQEENDGDTADGVRIGTAGVSPRAAGAGGGAGSAGRGRRLRR